MLALSIALQCSIQRSKMVQTYQDNDGGNVDFPAHVKDEPLQHLLWHPQPVLHCQVWEGTPDGVTQDQDDGGIHLAQEVDRAWYPKIVGCLFQQNFVNWNIGWHLEQEWNWDIDCMMNTVFFQTTIHRQPILDHQEQLEYLLHVRCTNPISINRAHYTIHTYLLSIPLPPLPEVQVEEVDLLLAPDQTRVTVEDG